MDDNDRDIAAILALQETASADPRTWAPGDYIDYDALSEEVRTLLHDLAPFRDEG